MCHGDDDDCNFDHEFVAHVHCNILHTGDQEHLPIPVFSLITPTISTSFLLHGMLSMGRFETEIDLFTHGSIKEFLKYCHLIGDNDNEEYLQHYAEDITKRFIKEQMQYFPNAQRFIDLWIITTFNLISR